MENVRLEPGDVVSIERTVSTAMWGCNQHCPILAWFVRSVVLSAQAAHQSKYSKIAGSHMPQNTEQLHVTADSDFEATSLSHPFRRWQGLLRIVLFRPKILIVSLIASLLLGGLYYATATRVYEANASLLVMQDGTAERNGIDGGRASRERSDADLHEHCDERSSPD